MKTHEYRVVLLYPDYAAKTFGEHYGEASFADTVEANTPEQAITECREVMNNTYKAHDPDGFEDMTDALVVDCYQLGSGK